MNEADRLAQQRLDAQRSSSAARAASAAKAEAGRRASVLQQIRSESAQVLSLLKQAGYPNLEPLTFQVKKLFGGYKTETKAGWKLGMFYFEGSNARSEGNEPLHLLSDGALAAFGRSWFDLSELDDETWWGRRAPETILAGLKTLRAELESPSADDEPPGEVVADGDP